jgi:hypothetical protein
MWDTLIPQVVWRGTDFVYLQTLYPELGRPSLDSHIAPHLDRGTTMDLKQQAIRALESAKKGLVPRWKGILHTADAELSVQQLIEKQGRTEGEKRRMKEHLLPWCNIKFSHFVSDRGVKSETKGSAEYRMWERMDFPAAGESLGMEELAMYKCEFSDFFVCLKSCVLDIVNMGHIQYHSLNHRFILMQIILTWAEEAAPPGPEPFKNWPFPAFSFITSHPPKTTFTNT